MRAPGRIDKISVKNRIEAFSLMETIQVQSPTNHSVKLGAVPKTAGGGSRSLIENYVNSGFIDLKKPKDPGSLSTLDVVPESSIAMSFLPVAKLRSNIEYR